MALAVFKVLRSPLRAKMRDTRPLFGYELIALADGIEHATYFVLCHGSIPRVDVGAIVDALERMAALGVGEHVHVVACVVRLAFLCGQRAKLDRGFKGLLRFFVGHFHLLAE